MIRKTILFLSILVLLSSYVSATDTCFYPSGIPRCQAAECNTIFPVAGSWSYESNSCQDFGDSVAVYYDAVCDNTEPVFNAVVPGTNAGHCALNSARMPQVACPSAVRMGRTVVFGDCICQAVIDGPWAACTEGQVSGRMRLADPFFQGESICDNDNVCENPPETCSNCPNDCHCDPVPEFSVVGVGIATFLIGLIGGMFMQKKKK